jgi:hypothetical protein
MATDTTVGRPFAQADAKRQRLTAITAASSGAAMLDGDRARHAHDDLALEPSPPAPSWNRAAPAVRSSQRRTSLLAAMSALPAARTRTWGPGSRRKAHPAMLPKLSVRRPPASPSRVRRRNPKRIRGGRQAVLDIGLCAPARRQRRPRPVPRKGTDAAKTPSPARPRCWQVSGSRLLAWRCLSMACATRSGIAGVKRAAYSSGASQGMGRAARALLFRV